LISVEFQRTAGPRPTYNLPGKLSFLLGTGERR
jgi:hypothetical protein